MIKNSNISSYIPEDINCNLNPIFTVCGTPVVVEAIGISYNPSYYKTCPINNWWELIETPWYQKVCMPNVTRNVTGFSVALMIFENEALLEKSYKEYYHTE